MSPEETEILAVERKLARAEGEARTLRQELAAIRQGLDEVYGLISQLQTAPVPCNATLSGRIVGCDGTTPLVGVTVTVTETATGAVLGAYATNGAGDYSGPITLPTGGATPATFAIPAAPGFQALLWSFTLQCTANSIPAKQPALATGYVCVKGHALPTTLYLTDAFGTIPLAYNATLQQWTGFAQFDSPDRVAQDIFGACFTGPGRTQRNYVLSFPGAAGSGPKLVQGWNTVICSGANALTPVGFNFNAQSTIGAPASASYNPFVGAWDFPTTVGGTLPVAVPGHTVVSETP